MEPRLSEHALLVSGHDLLAQTITRSFRAEGIQVDRTSLDSTEQILEAADEGRQGLAVLHADHAGEGGDLHQLVAGLRARGLAVVVLTDSAEIEQSALEQGASHVVHPSQGAASLRHALGMRARRA